MTFFQQLRALVWRNYLLKRRNVFQLYQELTTPIMFVLILGGIKSGMVTDTKPALHYPIVDTSAFKDPFQDNKYLLVVPNTNETRHLTSSIISQLTEAPQVQFFDSMEEAELKYKENKDNVLAGLEFNSSGSYIIRMAYKDLPSEDKQKSISGCRRKPLGANTHDCEVNKYVSTGFLQLQLAIENSLLLEFGVSNHSVSRRKLNLRIMDKWEYTPSTNYIQSLSSIYFVFSFCFLANYLAVNIVAEKEKKIKDGMQMMGLRASAFWLSWTIIYFILIIVIAGLMVAIVYGMKFFSNVNAGIVYLLLILYGISFIAFAFMITPFFKSSRAAGVVTGFGTVILSLLHLAVSTTRDETSYNSDIPASAQWLLCLLSPVAFASAIDQVIFIDLHLSELSLTDAMKFGDFPLYAPYLMLVVDTFIYAILTMYLDRVMPGEFGARYPPLYFLQPSYWFPSSDKHERSRLLQKQPSMTQQADVEGVASNMDDKVAVRISALTKSFQEDSRTVNAVDGFWLDVYEGQITCLLGHNGAGKTTLINMLTGVVEPTQGSATVLGYDITDINDMQEIRKKCGICPQHNILYDTLSCMEHLKLFAQIKGVPEHDVEKVAKQTLKDVDLSDQADTFASNLSGGQKRKLSVGIALIGDPTLIFLDEPTAGMDPFSRRHLWSLLKQRKEGRVVLLTTHFMDEADILADRKAFIRKGKLRCCGSSLFLKSKFGVGYHLTMVVDQDSNTSQITSMLQSVVADIEHQRSHGNELAYTLPLSDISKFAELFTLLDERSQELKILNYGVSMTTLEEVFLKLEGEDEIDASEEVLDGLNEEQFVNKAYSNNHDHDSADQGQFSVDMNSTGGAADKYSRSSVTGSQLTKQRFWALLRIRFLLCVKNWKAIAFQIWMPVTLVVVSLIIAKVTNSVKTPTLEPVHMSPKMYVNSSNSSSYPSLPNLLIFDSLNNNDSKAIVSDMNKNYYTDVYPTGSTNTSSIFPHSIGLQINDTVGQMLTDFVIEYNDSSLHSLPVTLNLASQSMLDLAKINETINVTSLPWSGSEEKLKFDITTFMVPLLVGTAFVMIIPGFSIDIVRDREFHLRSQLRIAGVSFNVYWGSIYCFNMLLCLLPCLLFIIIVIAMQVKGFSSAGAIGLLILLFVVNLPFNILFAAVVAFIFDKSEKCSAYFPQLLNLFCTAPYIAVSIIDMGGDSSTAVILHYIFTIINPAYILTGGLYFLSRISLKASVEDTKVSAADYFDFSNHAMISVIMPLINIIWMYWLLRVLDIWKTGGSILEAFPCFAKSTTPFPNNDLIEDEDDDVKMERNRVEAFLSREEMEPVAFTSQLRKTFVRRTGGKSGLISRMTNLCSPGSLNLKKAVRNLSIGVSEGEVLGLLGPNGAGKSTAMNMITAETAPTAGKVVVSGHNVRANTLSVLQSLGYCPQHDALWELISLEEHIRCFAAIKGISPSIMDELIKFYVNSLKLAEHRQKQAKKLSGGTKRKLSYIMSMLGSPKLVLLDEPSTGMDPKSKRFLWDTISTSFQGSERGALLTTHYMEEADALCGRVGIMVNGALRCLGSTQHLKSKYGSGYILEVKLRLGGAIDVEGLMDLLEDKLRTIFPGLKTVERFMERGQYSIPKHDVTSLGKTFAQLEECKDSHCMEEYNFSQSTLEQVFLHFARQQVEEEEDEMARPIKMNRTSPSV